MTPRVPSRVATEANPVSELSDPKRTIASRDSGLMLAALGILAYAASMMTHEALGHGGYCLAFGGHNVMLTAWGEGCNPHVPGIEVAGPGLQFGAGLLAWYLLGQVAVNAARLRYFLWLYMAFSLFVFSGYVLFSGVTNFGDAAVLIEGLKPPLVWRGGLVLLGTVAYFLSMRAAATELKRFAGADYGNKRLWRLVWIPYVAAGGFACCCGALNQTMGGLSAIGLAAASSFGGGFGLLRLPDMQRGLTVKADSPTAYLTWSMAWGTGAAITIALFVFFVGPGIRT
jgi:hypothetical protein